MASRGKADQGRRGADRLGDSGRGKAGRDTDDRALGAVGAYKQAV